MIPLAALMGAATYYLYNLIGRDPKKEELSDELEELRAAKSSALHWGMTREVMESIHASEAAHGMSATEASLALYRGLEARFQRKASSHETRIKVLEADIKASEEHKAKKQREEDTEVARLRSIIVKNDLTLAELRTQLAQRDQALSELRARLAAVEAEEQSRLDQARAASDKVLDEECRTTIEAHTSSRKSPRSRHAKKPAGKGRKKS